MRLDLSLENGALYQGCEIRRSEGRGKLNLKTPKKLAAPVIRENLAHIISEIPTSERSVELTGRTPMWVYLVVLPLALKSFEQVYYDDGSEKMLIAP